MSLESIEEMQMFRPRLVDGAPPIFDLPPPRFTLYTADQLAEMPDQEMAVRDVFPAQGLAAVVGPSGSGKSFVVLELAAKLGEAGTWFGHGVARVHRVVILVLEGEVGFRKRVRAWEIAKGRPFPKAVKFVFDSFDLQDRNDTMALAEVVLADGGCDVLMIDTLNRATPGADENSSRDASLILQNAKELQELFDGLVLIIHHTGKDVTKGMRGHSSLFGAMDAVVDVCRTGDRREIEIKKVKDGEDGVKHGFALEVVQVGEDTTGDPITSCVIRVDDAPADNTPRPPKGGNQRIVYDALLPHFRDSGKFGKGDAPAIRPCLEIEEAIELVKDRLAVDQKRRRERVQQAITGMVASRILGCSQGWIWLI